MTRRLRPIAFIVFAISCSAMFLASGGAQTQGGTAQRYRLQVEGEFLPGGYKLKSVTPDSPSTKLTHADTGAAGKLSLNHVIVSINGVRIRKAEDYYGVLNASADGKFRLRIRDLRTFDEDEWFVQGVLVNVPREQAGPEPNSKADPQAKPKFDPVPLPKLKPDPVPVPEPKFDPQEKFGAKEFIEKKYKLGISWNWFNGQMQIIAVTKGSPASRVVREKTGNKGTLEPGDRVLAINDWKIRSNDDFFNALNASPDGVARLQIRDRNSGQMQIWIAQLDPLGADVDSGAGRVKFLLVGDTLGLAMAKADLVNMSNVMKTTPGYRPGDMSILHSEKSSAQNIMNAVRSMPVRPADTLFVYFTGHGGYDPAYGAGDPSGGHFVGTTTGALLRKDLLGAMRARGARLTVLLTDACNGKVQLAPPKERFGQKPGEMGDPVLGSLLLKHSGIVDINGSSRDQLGFSAPQGGVFTLAFFHAIDDLNGLPYVPWDDFLKEMSRNSSEIYKDVRSEFLRNPEKLKADFLRDLQNQTDQRPQAFIMDVRRTK